MKSSINKVLFCTFYYFFLLAVILLGGLFVLTFVPIAGSTLSVKIVQSGSMEPTIKTGSIVVIKPQERYQVGEIITFGREQVNYVSTTHRIISDRVEKGVVLYTTRGDANNVADAREVSHQEIIGKVLFSVPWLGYVFDFARKPIGFILLIVIPVGFLAFEEGVKIARELYQKKKRSNKKEENKKEDTEEKTCV